MPSRPRVLVVVTLAEIGGAQAYVRDLVAALAGPYDVTVAAHGPGVLGDTVRARGAAFVPLRHVRRSIGPRDILGLLELWWLCRRLRPEIVHANSSKAGILARVAAVLARVPVRLFTAHGWAFKATSGAAAWLYLVADRLVAPLTTAVICVSDEERRAGLAARVCRPGRTVTIHNGVELVALPERRDDNPVRIVSVGRLAEPKDFATLLSAASEITAERPWMLDIVGDGPERPQHEERAVTLGLSDRVRFLGEVTDVSGQLREARVFVLSSRSEGLPISVLEAMAAGLPVVASDVGGLRELVAPEESGILVPAASPAPLAAALSRLVDAPELRASMGAEGRRRVEASFTIKRCREAHLALYARLLPTGD